MEAISHSSGPIFGEYHIVLSTSYSAELWGAEGQRPGCPVLTVILRTTFCDTYRLMIRGRGSAPGCTRLAVWHCSCPCQEPHRKGSRLRTVLTTSASLNLHHKALYLR